MRETEADNRHCEVALTTQQIKKLLKLLQMTMKDGIQMIALTFQWGTFLGKSDVDFNSESKKSRKGTYLLIH